jgi:feruloyl esterase
LADFVSLERDLGYPAPASGGRAMRTPAEHISVVPTFGRAARPWLIACAIATASTRPLPAAGTACTALVDLRLADITIVSATTVAAGPFTPPAPAAARTLLVPAFCRVAAVATPTADSHINFEVWIPEGGSWNRKFQGVGTGGFAGSISYAALADGVRRGYATASTDTGHLGDDLTFAYGHPEKIIDWAYRSVHLMTEAGKLIVRNHTGQFPDRAYFNGCATGGHQAMMEVQRFPTDYDGVVAGNPAADRTNEIIAYLWDWRAAHTSTGASLIDPAKF